MFSGIGEHDCQKPESLSFDETASVLWLLGKSNFGWIEFHVAHEFNKLLSL